MKKHKEVSWGGWLGVAIIWGLLCGAIFTGMYLSVSDPRLGGAIYTTDDFIFFIIGAISFCLIGASMMGRDVSPRWRTVRKEWWAGVLHALGLIAGFVVVVCGLGLTSGPSGAGILPTDWYPDLWAIGLSASLALMAIVWHTVWRRPVIADNKLVIFRGRVFCPGETFPIRPILSYDPTVIEPEMPVTVCGETDGVTWEFRTHAVPLIEHVIAEGIRSVSGDPFEEIEGAVVKECRRWLSESPTPLSETVHNHPTTISFFAAGLPMVWRSAAGDLVIHQQTFPSAP